MSQKSLSQSLTTVNAFDIQSITSDTTTNGEIIDTLGFESLTFIGSSGALNAGTFTPEIKESDDDAMAGETVVPANQLLNTIASATFADTEDNARKKLGVLNLKRYVTYDIVSAGASGANTLGVTAVLGNPLHTNIT